jgi:hypothetical protein
MSAARMAASRRGNEGSSSMTCSRAPIGEQMLVLHIALRIASTVPVADGEGASRRRRCYPRSPYVARTICVGVEILADGRTGEQERAEEH